MKKFETRIDTKSPEFEKNRSAYLELVATLRDRQQFAIRVAMNAEKSTSSCTFTQNTHYKNEINSSVAITTKEIIEL